MRKRPSFVVLGASGHIGSAVAKSLLKDGHKVIAVVRNEAKGAALASLGAEIAVVNVGDTQALRAVFRLGNRAFLLNPPAAVEMDTDLEENRTATSIADALGGTRLEKVVVESTYGAQQGDGIGDLSVLWNFERQAGSACIPMAINRGAYYFTNLDALLDQARSGTITTMFPVNLKMPMVAPSDLGLAAANRLTSPVEDAGVRFVEGPERYSFDNVAKVFAEILGHGVKAIRLDRSKWLDSFRQAGFSERAAKAYEKMTEISTRNLEMPKEPLKGTTSLRSHLLSMIGANKR